MIRRGLFSVYKPPGLTSAEVTNKLKLTLLSHSNNDSDYLLNTLKQVGRLKIGHGGTLDKFAEGVLVIGIGEDCKKLGHYQKGVNKKYEAIGHLGKATDTLDLNGKVTERKEWDHITGDNINQTLKHFCGDITQSTPLYSAVKLNGQRLSDYARDAEQKGLIANIKPPLRNVHIHSLTLLNFSPPLFHISVCCSSGTYIRSLVRDIAEQVGTVAYVEYLCRTCQGPFTLEHAVREEESGGWSLDRIKSAIQQGKELL